MHDPEQHHRPRNPPSPDRSSKGPHVPSALGEPIDEHICMIQNRHGLGDDMIKTMAAMIAVAGALAIATPATAQTKYYARERLVGLSTQRPITYVPTYSTTYTACSNGTQKATIQSCATSEGAPAKLSDCAAQPQTVSRKCTAPTVTCGVPMSRYWWGDGTGTTDLGTASTAGDAQKLCNDHVKGTTIPGVCYWKSNSPTDPTGGVTYYRNAGLYPNAPGVEYNASACTLG